jgi:hypothetical protein
MNKMSKDQIQKQNTFDTYYRCLMDVHINSDSNRFSWRHQKKDEDGGNKLVEEFEKHYEELELKLEKIYHF